MEKKVERNKQRMARASRMTRMRFMRLNTRKGLTRRPRLRNFKANEDIDAWLLATKAKKAHKCCRTQFDEEEEGNGLKLSDAAPFFKMTKNSPATRPAGRWQRDTSFPF